MLIHVPRVLVSFALLLVALTAACGARSEPPAVAPDVWAVVNGVEITRQDVEKAYRRADQPPRPASEYEEQTIKLNLLNELILQEILLAQARELKIELPASELDTALADTKKGLTDEVFNKELAARELTQDDVREELRRNLLVQKLMEREVTSKVAVSDQQITEFFEANKARFNRTEDTYHLAQIVVTPMKEPQVANRTGNDAASPEQATVKARMIMERLKAGTRFEDLAMDFSEDAQSAPRAGDVGLVTMSALKQAPAALRDGVLKTNPGDVTMIPMQGGYTIVAVISKAAAGQDDLSMPQVKESITAALRGPREQLLRSAFINTARDKATVVNYLARRLVASEGKLETTTQPAK